MPITKQTQNTFYINSLVKVLQNSNFNNMCLCVCAGTILYRCLMVRMRTLPLLGDSAAKSPRLRLSLVETLYSSNSPPTMKAQEPDSASAMRYTAQVPKHTHKHSQRSYNAHAHTLRQRGSFNQNIDSLVMF